jgi:hypothetical protein
MRAGKIVSSFRFQPAILFLTVTVLLASVTALATRTPHSDPQIACPSQAECDHLRVISDLAAAEAAAAKSVADQAEADRQKDLATANRLDSQASHPDPELYPRSSDKVGYGQSMRAQAQGLRDKLANAKANAAAKAKIAADAAKAYQDCVDRMKACAPKETTPAPPVNLVIPQFGRRAAREGQPVACSDGTTTTAVVDTSQKPNAVDILKKSWDGKKWEVDANGNLLFNPFNPDLPSAGGIRNWILDPDPITPIHGLPPYIPPPCFIDGDGKVTIGPEPGSYGPPIAGPYSGYFPLPPTIIPRLRWDPNPPVSDPPATINPQPSQRLPRLYAYEPPEQFVRPQNYYDERSQYFWLFDLFGLPYYCSFDFPDSLRSFPEIKHALTVEAAMPRKHEGVITPERADARMQLASFHGASPFSDAPGSAPAPQNRTSAGQSATPNFSYSIVSNGKSTGEAFQLQLLDTTGKVKSVSMRSGVVLEAIAPGVTQPVAATSPGSKVVTQPMSGFCLEFGKHPPAEGTQYRIAGDAAQQKFRPMRFVSRAGQQMEQKKAFHPDSNPKAYSEAILQYALWSKLEGWSQEQFTQHFVERTKENADALHVKWTGDMEKALRAAAPGRWKDISEMLQEAQVLEKNSGQGRGGRTGGRGGGRGGRRGAANSVQ